MAIKSLFYLQDVKMLLGISTVLIEMYLCGSWEWWINTRNNIVAHFNSPYNFCLFKAYKMYGRLPDGQNDVGFYQLSKGKGTEKT